MATTIPTGVPKGPVSARPDPGDMTDDDLWLVTDAGPGDDEYELTQASGDAWVSKPLRTGEASVDKLGPHESGAVSWTGTQDAGGNDLSNLGSVGADQLSDTVHFVDNTDDLQSVYNSAPADSIVVISEDYDISATLDCSIGNGAALWFQGSLIPTTDLNPVVNATKCKALIGDRQQEAVHDANAVMASTSVGILYHSKIAFHGFIYVREAGIGHRFEQAATGDNMNSISPRLRARDCAGDGVQVENTSTNAQNLNYWDVVAICTGNGGMGYNQFPSSGTKCQYHIKSFSNTGRACRLTGTYDTGYVYEEGNGSVALFDGVNQWFKGAFQTGTPSVSNTDTRFDEGSSYYSNNHGFLTNGGTAGFSLEATGSATTPYFVNFNGSRMMDPDTGSTTSDPTTTAPTNWIRITIGANARYIPIYS